MEMSVQPLSGGWEDWDLETTVALELIEDILEEEQRRKKFIEDAKAQPPRPLGQSSGG